MQETNSHLKITIDLPIVSKEETFYTYINRIDNDQKQALFAAIKTNCGINKQQLKNRVLKRTAWTILEIKTINNLLNSKVLNYDNN